MEIKYKSVKNNLNFTIKDQQINGITGSNTENINDIIRVRDSGEGKILADGKELKDIASYIKEIKVVTERFPENVHNASLFEYMLQEIRHYNIYPKNINKKIVDSLKIVGLKEELLERNIYSCSTAEKKMIQIAIALLTNPSVIILEEPFNCLDFKNTKRLVLLFRKMKEQYHKTIIIISNDPEILYKYTDHLIIYINGKILDEGQTDKVYTNVDMLRRHKIKVPELVEFTYKARTNKNIKIDYHKDIRDLIKDIYKHV